MTNTEQFIAGCITATILFWTPWLIRRARARRREARELIRSARRGTDLQPHTDFHDHPKTDVAANFQHWSDTCTNCHHDRAKHHLGYGICLQLRARNDVCDCTAFERSN